MVRRSDRRFNDAIYGNAIKVLGGNIQIHADGYHSETGQNPLLPLANDQALIKAAEAQPKVVAAARRINTSGLVTNRKGAFGVSIVGIEPDREQAVNLIAQNIAAGKYLAASDQDVILIGKGLADAMEVKLGERITLSGRGAHNQMRSRTVTIGGIYDLGMGDFEKRSVYISLAEAQDLYGLSGQSTEVALTLKSIGQEPEVITALSPSLSGYEVNSWQTSFPELKNALETKSGVMNVFSVIILIIAGIGILNMLLMAIYERTREIGILGAFGMKPGQISWLFLLEGAMIGLVGVVFGVVIGLAINIILGRVGLDFTQYGSMASYMALISGRVYPSLGVEKLPQRVVTVIIISILSSLLPAREAAQREPAEALHYV